MGDYRLASLLDLAVVQNMADAHYRAAGMPIGIIDAIDGSVLVGSGWQDICVKFHRAHPAALKRCQESDNYIKERLVVGEACHYKCKNGLWDVGMPIVVAGQHLATMFLGQFFYEGEAPDREFFKTQARDFGFDVDDYLAALDRVPTFSREKVDYILQYDLALVTFIGDLAEQAVLKQRADSAVRESERKFHAIFDHAYQFIGLLSVEGTLLEANEAALSFIAGTQADVVGRPFWETPWWTHSPELQEKVRQAVQAAAKGQFVRFEVTLRSADGRLRCFDFSLKPVANETGTVVLIIPEIRDITERKNAEEEIRQQAEFLQQLIDAAPYPVFWKDAEQKYRGCNRAFEQLYCMRRNEIAGKTVYDIAPKELADLYFRTDNELLSHPGRQMYESQVRSADGKLLDVIFHKATFDGPDGTPAGLIGVIVDISERKRSEEERCRLQEELAQSQRMESVGRLAGGVAHDFNNMLSIILGYAELILLKLDPSESLYQEVMQIQTAAERSRDVTRQLLAFARKEIVEPRVVDLNSSVEGTLKILRRIIGEDITLVFKPGDSLWPIFMDPSQLDQILANLCVNARDAIANIGRIVIETGTAVLDTAYCSSHDGISPGDHVWLSITDNGCGMDSETLDKVFEPFFTTKDMGNGAGLGLATVYGIIKQNNGTIEVQSEPGVGTTFKLYLPRHETSFLEQERPAADESPKGHGETVLVVEDEAAILQLTRQILTEHNYNVITAESPSEALRLAQASPEGIALLITDVVMPEMNGRELVERLKGSCPKLVCLYMSGYTPDAMVDRGLLDWKGHFIQKPWTPQDLVLKIKAVLTESSPPVQAA